MDRLKGKIAIVTGAAMGMGQSEAILFAQEGATVIVSDINETIGQETVETINAFGGQAVFMKHDVADEDHWKHVVNEVVAKFGKVDILINNAGCLLFKTLEDTTSNEWDRLFNVNAKSAFLGCKYIAPAMRKAGGGSIVNISSIYGLVGAPSVAALVSAKGAVRLLTKAAAIDYAKDNIRVNSIHPGLIDTPLTANIMADPALFKHVLAGTIMRRPGKPEEVAKVALFLASDDSSYMTGSELVVDGGYTSV